MASNAVATLKEWFHGPGSEEVALPRSLTLRFGSALIAIDVMILLLMSAVAWRVSVENGHGVLGAISFMVWVALMVLIVWEFWRSAKGQPSMIRPTRGIDTYLVPKWYARTATGTAVVLAIIFLIAVF